MPNLFATLMLAVWPLITLLLFALRPPRHALIWSLLLGYLLLPERPAGFDFPMMPPLDKHNIPALAAFFLILTRHGPPGPLLPLNPVAWGLTLIFVFSPLFTALTNPAPVHYGVVHLPGLGLKEAVALVLGQILLILPFLLARQFIATGGAQRVLMRALVVAAVLYTIPMLIEIRLSPQLNLWIYGWYQHEFAQTIRFGGFRPMVFLYHGIWVAFFALTGLICAVALWRTRGPRRPRMLLAAVWLTIVLILAKSLGAILFAVLLLPLTLFLGNRMQIRIALLLALLATAYPVLKNADLIPEDRMLNAAARVDPDRAASLRFRFDNETRLIERAYEKPFFGWGSYGRNQIFDPRSGEIDTVTDGRWIILIGVYGWIGYLAEFGLLLWPLVMLWWLSRGATARLVAATTGPLCLLLAINIVDLLPNATLTPVTWLITGALLGHAERLSARRAIGRVGALRLKWKPVM
ncbi:hypothetical protein [Citreimonas salinaria]|uniref:O-Antigen ligase n=1 Tax=Citreimonas salinaria TaxID=321339 RepID=A0A1H3KCW8_9RHOB|nr:hypothetical protein [Citreimonas salinaria]SDY49779.1 hypothetical protein SAMN05444340_10951 [Citreimonas salinaria]